MSCANQAQKRKKTNMSTEETNTAATVAEQGAHVAPEKAPSKKGASQKKGAPKSQKAAKGGKSKASRKKSAPKGQKAAKGGKHKAGPKKGAKASKKAKTTKAKDASAPRPESKGAKILATIGRAKGATLTEIMKATDWQAHSVRGFLSTAAKKHALKIESAKTEAGERSYSLTA